MTSPFSFSHTGTVISLPGIYCYDAIQKIKDDERIGGGGGVQTAEQAGFSAAASEDPSNYENVASEANDWL